MALLLNAGDTVSRSYSYTQPSPLHPSQPQGTGERTGNLLNPSSTATNTQGAERYGDVFRAGTYCIINNSAYDLFWRDGVSSTSGRTIRANASEIITTSNELVVWHTNYSTDIMVAEADVIIPFEPYGYKIPISSAGQTTPVYLGEVETTRRIKKLVFDGTEGWEMGSENFYVLLSNNGIAYSYAYCSHAEYGKTLVNNNGTALWARKTAFSDYTTAADFKAWLATQYANGTPVTVWYVLATPTTGIVNEPLRKISDYADTVSDISIPTISGADTLSVGATLQPSEVTVNYHGWHPIQNVHEADNGAWS